jgi:hypothetical protein
MIFGKRGQEHPVLFVIVDLAMISIVAIVFLVQLRDFRDSILFDKIYLSKDIALLSDSVYASPGSLDYVYSGVKDNFSVNLDNGVVSVYYKELADPIKNIYTPDDNVETDINYTFLSVINNSNVNFEKSSSSLKISGSNKTFKSDSLACFSALSYYVHPTEFSVVLDPSYTDSFDSKFANLSFDLSSFVFASLPAGVSRIVTRDKGVGFFQDERLRKTVGRTFLVSFVVKKDFDKVNVYMRDDNLETKKLACLLMYKLSEMGMKMGTVGVSDDDFIMHNNANVSVIVEVGDSLDPMGYSEFGKKVSDALEAYYD